MVFGQSSVRINYNSEESPVDIHSWTIHIPERILILHFTSHYLSKSTWWYRYQFGFSNEQSIYITWQFCSFQPTEPLTRQGRQQLQRCLPVHLWSLFVCVCACLFVCSTHKVHTVYTSIELTIYILIVWRWNNSFKTHQSHPGVFPRLSQPAWCWYKFHIFLSNCK